jgi:hypothetical protein
MTNQSLQGRVIDKANPPVGIQNPLIEVYDHHVLKLVDFLDTAATDASGSYGVSYAKTRVILNTFVAGSNCVVSVQLRLHRFGFSLLGRP